MKYKILAVFILISTQPVIAQDSLTWKLATIAVTRNGHEIGIGEKVPDILFDKMLNYPLTQTSLHELNSKPIIVEFWHQYCSVCRGELPKLNALYQQYKDSVQFLMVTFQSEALTKEFMQQQASVGKPILLPLAVEDTLLRKTFGHDGDPHVVWISKEGVVQAISTHTALTKEHIAQWLREKNIKLALKSNQKDFDADKLLFSNKNNDQQNAVIFRSMITGYIDSIPAYPFHITNEAGKTKLLITNATLDQMFKECYMRYDTSTIKYLDVDWMNKHLLYKTKDSSTTANWTNSYNSGYDALEYFQRNHMYCYELVLPGRRTDAEMAAYALKDLERSFHINPSFQKETIKGLALVRINKEEKFKSKGIDPSKDRPVQDSVMIIHNIGMWSLVNVLNLNYNFPFVVDETGYQGKVDIAIPFQKNNIGLIKQKLREYGLDLMPKEFNLPMIVLNDD